MTLSHAPEPSVELVVLGELARGGMALVELARVLPAGDVLALKRLLPQLAMDRDFVQMFMDEAWIGAALAHENIVRVLACGEDEAGMFLAMELVYGAPLGAIADAAREHGEPFPAELVALVTHGVARGLEAAHGLRDSEGVPFGLVHRDVTPSNVLVGFDGAVKLTDFGVARAAGRASQTAEGMLKGKLSFLAPEYASARQLDARSDLYSLGVTLFWLVTGRRPFEGPSDAELLRRITDESPPRLGDVVPDFDPALAELVMRLLRKDPRERPANAGAVCQELDGWFRARQLERDALGARLGAFVSRHGEERRRRIDELVGAAAAPPVDEGAANRVTLPDEHHGRATVPARRHRRAPTPLAETTARLAPGLPADSAADFDGPTLPIEDGRESRRATLRRAVPGLELRRTRPHETRVVAAPVVRGAAPSLPGALGAARLPTASSLGQTPRGARGLERGAAEGAAKGRIGALLGIAALLATVIGSARVWLAPSSEPGAARLLGRELGDTATRAAERASRLPATAAADSSSTSALAAPSAEPTASAGVVAPAGTISATSSPSRPPPPPKPRPTSSPRSCTPSDFDYPNCRGGK